ncbi:AfsR/SARP family transcriptional regulator [Streptomyces radicis]|uniref:SARP family transcriptional regulator n=1 Tax=Streptomyces radicis TaxID=1750517 RepID=A0A3A9W0J0_9ACTN|nr:BTAD domain-containing putative transcriptional regulator [Streptomyces radicis]RKN06262.1 SARP family transcriptional regulator [Streptomyces radicis]RKN18592.1 SARP family transcriptional regulator [Streptomyces radicis]
MRTEFALLGAVEATVDGRPVDLGHARQRWTLAALLVDVGRPVPLDELVARLWGGRAPQRAEGTLYSYLSRLRRVLAPGGDVAIGRGPGGYVLDAEPTAVDLHRFRALTGRARAADGVAERAAPLQEALGLWRGEAQALPDTPWFGALRGTLERERLAAELDLGDALLGLGRDEETLARLVPHGERHPLDERLAGQLMLALHRVGRGAEALERYERLRRRLADELGADPGDALRRLHRRILADDPGLATPTFRMRGIPLRPLVPRQLPASTALFTGRERELDQLDDALAQGGVAAIGGAGGVGKTWLALRWAHTRQARFPDGQLYADLRGFHPTSEPVDPETAVRGFLAALGVDASAVPPEREARIGLFRSLTAGRRMLVVLDNVRDSEQVAPLLPGGPGCAALVTGRHRLTGLATAHGARLVTLDVLPPPEARQLLGRHLGAGRVAAEPETAAELLERCAGLPLAIGLLAARAAGQPDAPLSALAEQLREAGADLDALDGGELNADLRSVLATSHRALAPGLARAFALLGLAPGPDVGPTAAVALLGEEPAAARAALRRLGAAHLISPQAGGRYRMHDLTRRYAAERAAQLPPGVRESAVRRLVAAYLHAAYRVDQVLFPSRVPFAVDPPDGVAVPSLPENAGAALAWFDAEHEALLAVQAEALRRGWHEAAWRLAWVLDTYHLRRASTREHIAAWTAGLTGGERLGDPVARGQAYGRLGGARLIAGEVEEALRLQHRALAIFDGIGDPRHRGDAHRAISYAHELRGDDREALAHASRALELAREEGAEPRRLAYALNAVGWYEARLGLPERARAHCGEAAALLRPEGDVAGLAAVLSGLGQVAQRMGDPVGAVEHYRESVELNLGPLGRPRLAADTLVDLADAYEELGQAARAGEARRRALELFSVQRRPREAERVRALLGPG